LEKRIRDRKGFGRAVTEHFCPRKATFILDRFSKRARVVLTLAKEETVKTHVGNILAKLHLAHHTQAALYALKQGLVGLDEVEV
jgi:hypothetical protein